MASFKVVLKPSIAKDLRGLSKPVVARVLKLFEALAEEPFPRQSLKLEGSDALYRIRLGDYRVIYDIDPSRRQR
jgi:mRNA interferase RelE/StbE